MKPIKPKAWLVVRPDCAEMVFLTQRVADDNCRTMNEDGFESEIVPLFAVDPNPLMEHLKTVRGDLVQALLKLDEIVKNCEENQK